MYCMNCGAQNKEDAKFCIKCGTNLERGFNGAEPKKKSRRQYYVLIAIVLVFVIIIVSVFDLWPWSTKDDRDVSQEISQDVSQNVSQEIRQDVGQEINRDVAQEQEEKEVFFLDKSIAECPDCQEAVEVYLQMVAAINDYHTSAEQFIALTEQLSAKMNHFCTATAIRVEDVPYAYYGSYGLYTGEWLGAGPSGKGSYIGGLYGQKKVTYTGDWGFGLPNGEGTLFRENYFSEWDMTYTGQMKDGKRHGKGNWFEEYDNPEQIANRPHYRIYEEAEYQNDRLTDFVTCVDYDAKTGEIIGYAKMRTTENGVPEQGEIWGPDELSPELKNVLGVAGSLFTIGATVYILGKTLNSESDFIYDWGLVDRPKTNEERVAELNRYQAEKAEERERLSQDAQRRLEDFQQSSADYYYSHQNDPDYRGSYQEEIDRYNGGSFIK